MPTQHTISVIICAYTLDRWGDLTAAVDSVRSQTRAPSQLLVVIDHNPELLAEAQASFPDVTVVESDRAPGLSGARNTGLAIATGDIVAFIDDDAIAAPTWLDELARGYTSDDVLGVGGFIAPLWDGRRPGWFPAEFDWVLGCTYEGMPEGAAVRNLIGANMSFRREVLAGVGGFDPGLGRRSAGAAGGEETGACIRALQHHPGGAFVYTPLARVDHRVARSRTTWRYFRQRCYGEGVSKAHLSRLVGARAGLSSERRHAFVTLPTGVGRALRDFARGDRHGIARAGALVAGLVFAGAGYVRGALTQPPPVDAPEICDDTVAPESPKGAEEPRPRLRVLMVTPRYFPLVGGVEHHVAQVARLLAQDADVTVLTTDTTGELPESEVVDDVRILRVPAWPRDRDYYFAPRIGRVIRSREWDIIHVQSYHTAVAPLAMLGALRAGIPYVLTFHGGGHSSRARQAFRRVQWRLLRPLLARARTLVAVAEFEADRFSAILRIPRERFTVIPNGSDLSTLEVEAERRRAGGRPVLASVGRLERYKGHQRVIEAMPGVLREIPGSTLRVIGSGPYQPELERLVDRLGLQGKVRIESIPASNRQTMAQTFVWCSLLVLMSEFETHPLAVIEALELGVPALVADTSGLRELSERGLARAVPLDLSPDELAAEILLELADPRPVPAVFAPTWEQCAQRLLVVYRNVLARRASTGPTGER